MASNTLCVNFHIKYHLHNRGSVIWRCFIKCPIHLNYDNNLFCLIIQLHDVLLLKVSPHYLSVYIITTKPMDNEKYISFN